MRIAIEGCAHGELDMIYDSIVEVAKQTGEKIDLLICCGDFQSTRNTYDLDCMAVPNHYKQIRTFYKYYSGEKHAPVLTIFIGGNHEASNYLQELPYGGWVAPNIYYMGYASVITVGGIRIAGISGIYKAQHLFYGHFELPPYDASTVRSVYHTRNFEIFRLKQLTGQIDIFLSHDWPCGVTKYGNEKDLIKRKPYFKKDIANNQLGSPPCMELLKQHYPSYWFSAHLHCKYAALVPKDDSNIATRFLALDKCLPKRQFLQVLEVPHNADKPIVLSYDLEWLTILYLTNNLLNVQKSQHYLPTTNDVGRSNYTPTETEKKNILDKFNNNLEIPKNFEKTADAFQSNESLNSKAMESFYANNQTITFCQKLDIDDPSMLLQLMNDTKNKKTNDSLDTSNEIFSQSSKSFAVHHQTELPINDDFSFNDFLDDEDDKQLLMSPELILESIQSDKELSMKKFKRRNQSIYENP